MPAHFPLQKQILLQNHNFVSHSRLHWSFTVHCQTRQFSFFRAFGSSSEHLITNLIQSQGDLSWHPIISPILLGSNHLQPARQSKYCLQLTYLDGSHMTPVGLMLWSPGKSWDRGSCLWLTHWCSSASHCFSALLCVCSDDPLIK